MGKLYLAVELTDFDLDRVGFNLSVIDVPMKRQASEAYLRMTLTELHTFLGALKSAGDKIKLVPLDPLGVSRPRESQRAHSPQHRQAAAA
jgi:hypothetical protein